MAIANPEKTERMRMAVADVLAGRMTKDEAEREYKLHRRSIANAVCKARREAHQHGMHPALMMMQVIL